MEEVGAEPEGEAIPLTAIRQKGGKTVVAWGMAGDLDAAGIRSNTFTMEWPPRSGRMQEFPEVDRAAWMGLEEASARVNAAQVPLLQELADKLRHPGRG